MSEYFIAYETFNGIGDTVWGIGKSAEDAEQDGKKHFEEHHHRYPEINELTIIRCSQSLFEYVRRYGGDVHFNWKPESWAIERGIAVLQYGFRTPAKQPARKPVDAEQLTLNLRKNE